MSMHEGVPQELVSVAVKAAPCEWRDRIKDDRFPALIPVANFRPENCLVVGGKGSSSALHVDPFDWTGWSLLLSGRKEWRFFHHDPNGATGPWPPPEMRKKSGAMAAAGGSLGAATIADASALASAPTPFAVLTQSAGEFIFFPGGRWHQVKHTFGPTFAFCGQFCDTRVGGPVRALRHVASWSGLLKVKETFLCFLEGNHNGDFKSTQSSFLSMLLLTRRNSTPVS